MVPWSITPPPPCSVLQPHCTNNKKMFFACVLLVPVQARGCFGSPGTGVEIVVNCRTGAGNQTCTLWKIPSALDHDPSPLSSPHCAGSCPMTWSASPSPGAFTAQLSASHGALLFLALYAYPPVTRLALPQHRSQTLKATKWKKEHLFWRFKFFDCLGAQTGLKLITIYLPWPPKC